MKRTLWNLQNIWDPIYVQKSELDYTFKNMSYLQYQSSPEQFYSNNIGKAEYVRSDSTDDQIQTDYYMPKVVKTNICKYKTEMCKNFSENGFCPYRKKCQFAHGLHELSFGYEAPKKAYRTRKCKSFWEEGVCRYGPRCQFSHYEPVHEQEKEFLLIMKSMLAPERLSNCSKLDGILQKSEQ